MITRLINWTKRLFEPSYEEQLSVLKWLKFHKQKEYMTKCAYKPTRFGNGVTQPALLQLRQELDELDDKIKELMGNPKN